MRSSLRLQPCVPSLRICAKASSTRCCWVLRRGLRLSWRRRSMPKSRTSRALPNCCRNGSRMVRFNAAGLCIQMNVFLMLSAMPYSVAQRAVS
eukprot:6491490-Amphidinium_carterae.4